ncbi:hypothetical protein Moror_17362 [Moniliophthora roreri MCA 2997]|uniref:AB hydrolase-1 domain-containing protein n=2 Tax=Moniliophthora roreri TaxID=221103 RepID=V2XVL4_MONRO|nr:hypothetical protein Moror_17362 [Moniliophthora roreri MCA 2997]KAI3600338.1 hypothetical protein WG66_001872 [Moniliophthora roreri]
MQSLSVDEKASVHLSFLDSGPPQSHNYTTIFAVHGLLFSASVFKKLLPLCAESNIRLVAINRRDYPGSTALTEEELEVFSDNSDSAEQNGRREEFIRARGLELMTFMNVFIQKHDLPPISEVNGSKSGGVALLGWSLGNATTFSAIASISSAPEATRKRFSAYLRTLILLEPALVPLGMKPLPGSWVPTRDAPGITPSSAARLMAMLVTAYYTHSPDAISLDPQKQVRDPAKLEHVAPALPSDGQTHTPSIYSMSEEDMSEIVLLPPRPVPRADLGVSRQAALWIDAHHVNYYKACFSEEFREKLLLNMKVVDIIGDKTVSIVAAGLWRVWDDNEKEKRIRNTSKDFVEFRLMKGFNHFMHWDYPQETMAVLAEILS